MSSGALSRMMGERRRRKKKAMKNGCEKEK